MTDFNATAELVRRSAEKVRDFLALGDALKEIGSVDLARQEQQAALDKVNKALQTAKDDLTSTKAEHAAFMAQRGKDLEAHQGQAAAIKADAEMRAAQTTSAAEVNAKDIIDRANTEVARIQDAHAATMRDANAQLEKAREQLDVVTRALEAARSEQASLTRTIQDMRDLARNALGAA